MAKFGCISSLFVVWVACFGFVLASNIPDYIHICHRSDPRVSACIINSVEALRPRLVKGIPELNVPGIDPFELKSIVLFDPAQNPNMAGSLDNVIVRGAGKFEITKLKLDVEKKTYRAGVKIPLLDFEGDYKVDVKFLGTPIKSSGKFHANATDLEAQVIIQGAIAEDNKLTFTSIPFKAKIGDFNLDMENLVNNDAVLGKALRQLLSGNKGELINIATPYVEKRCSDLLLKLANQIVQNIDYDEVFPV